jgi:hypothetical protein
MDRNITSSLLVVIQGREIGSAIHQQLGRSNCSSRSSLNTPSTDTSIDRYMAVAHHQPSHNNDNDDNNGNNDNNIDNNSSNIDTQTTKSYLV